MNGSIDTEFIPRSPKCLFAVMPRRGLPVIDEVDSLSWSLSSSKGYAVANNGRQIFTRKPL